MQKTYGRGLDDGNSLDDLLLVHLGAGALKLTDGRGHTGLVAEEGSQVDGRLGVILGEGLGLSSVSGGTLARQESQRTVSGGFLYRIVSRRSGCADSRAFRVGAILAAVENVRISSIKWSVLRPRCIS